MRILIQGSSEIQCVDVANPNDLQSQITTLSAKENILSELVKESTPSGFTSLSALDYTYMSTNPNKIKLISDSVAFVAGYKTVIPAGTIIPVNPPPSTGTRDDLVFLECWKQADANGVISWNSRLRVVDGVDFNNLRDGLGAKVWSNSSNIMAQGGNVLPLVYNTFNSSIGSFYSSQDINTGYFNDVGLFSAGNSSQASKDLLKTTDGYCYAIPMFKISRRNSGGYSVNNANGGNAFYGITIPGSPTIQAGQVAQKVLSATDYIKVTPGDKVALSQISVWMYEIVSKDGNNTVTVRNLHYTEPMTGMYGVLRSKRSDLLFADIITDRDIIDLRHKVSLTGFNYQQLLEENFDKLLRGELQTKEKTKMLKTYHGINKTPIDANHVFYASLDGTTVAEVGGALSLGSGSFRPMPTGLGYKFNGDSVTPIAVSGLSASEGTIDLLINFDDVIINSNSLNGLVSLLNTNGYRALQFEQSATDIKLKVFNSEGLAVSPLFTTASTVGLRGVHELRARWSVTNNILAMYIDGKLVGSTQFNITILTPIKIIIGSGVGSIANAFYYGHKGTISDVSISNIDRGSVFATLPQDVIDGYARIGNAFNGQRQVFSDALTSQYTQELVKASSSGRPKQFTVTQGTSNQWTTGDTIKVTGLGGEIIGGVIDSDTALAKVVQDSAVSTNSVILVIDDISKFTIGDVCTIWTPTVQSSIPYTVSSIDSTNKTVVFSFSGVAQFFVGSLIFETTPSSSSPTVKANISYTAQAGTSTTITLPTTFNPTDNAYNGLDIMITSGTGAGQRRTISSYLGSTKVATVSSAWATIPDATSVFTIYNAPVLGTWAGLGTTEATFTLGTLYALNVQDIQVEYSLNQVAGQGGISEVLTTTLAGEANGKKLTVNPTVHVRDDFAGKIVGELTACSNVFKGTSSATLFSPMNFTQEVSQASYTAISKLDGVISTYGYTNVNGQIPQLLLQFNIIRMVEDKYGVIPANDKVKWCKDNIASIALNAYAYGSCPNGNKAKVYIYNNVNSAWDITAQNTSITPSLLNYSTNPVINPVFSKYLSDANGMTSFLVSTDASDGITPSQVNLDYAYLDIVLKTPTGYDVLAPENPRRDDGKANMLLVRKETKEIQCFMDCSNTDGIITYGNYIPDQSIAKQNGIVLATSDNLYLITGGTGGVSTGNYKNSASRIGMSSINSNLTGTIINSESADTITKTPIINEKLINKATTDGSSLIGKNLTSNVSKVITGVDLVKVNGEIYLKTKSKYDNSVTVNNSTSAITVDFKIENRILVK